MNKWQLQDAKNKLSNIVDIAMQGSPQCITRRGKEVVIVIGINDYKKLKKKKLGFSEFLMSGTKSDELELTRAIGKVRESELCNIF